MSDIVRKLSSFPLISIIMPIYNEANYIRKSLEAILNQDYPHERIEVIIVDGVSEDGTRETVLEIRNQNPKTEIALFDNQRRIVPVALNIGINNSKGDIIVRIDGHCEITSDYISQCVETLQRTGADCVGGHQRPVAKQLIQEAVALAVTSPFGTGNARFRHQNNSGWVDTVYMGAYRREVFDRIGMFDEELVRNQDDEFNFRLVQAGGKIWLDQNIRSMYYSRSNLKSLWRQYFQYGFWKLRVMQKRKAIASCRHLAPVLFVLGIAGSMAGFLITRNLWIALVIVGPYIIANMCAAIISARRRPIMIFILPIIFFIIHFSYGLGFLSGLCKWRRYFFHTDK
ncbi:MAG: glycosyltransferase family 2 protein [Candidatus Omnitrophica bacterium]|nr:glycosyltransferase family 2 protein [Candidatus Omnitrophota bacterium]